MKHPDGSVISQFFETTDKSMSGSDVYDQGLRLMVGQVDKVHYVDDKSNISKKHIEYDVSVRNGKGGQTTLRNIRKVDLLGGTNDQDETVFEPSEFAQKGKLNTSNFFVNKNGTTVLVAFIDGSTDKPIIIAAIQHPNKQGAKRADGIRRKGEFRGVQWEVNKHGELTITYQSDRAPDGKLRRKDTGPTIIKIDKTGALSIRDNENQLIKMDRVAKSIQIVTKENYVITVGKDMNVTIQGNETITTTGDRVHSAANHTLTGGGDIKIGSAGASENLVLGIQFQTLYNAHTHIGNLGVPTGVPTVPMSASELSQKNFTE